MRHKSRYYNETKKWKLKNLNNFIDNFIEKDFKCEKLDHYILAEIEKYYDKTSRLDYDILTLEHISDKQFKEKYLFKIGNQTLLTKETNLFLAGKPYNIKKEIFSTYSCNIVKNCCVESWGEEAVYTRSKILAEIASKIFIIEELE